MLKRIYCLYESYHISSLQTFPPVGSLLICQTVIHLVTLKDTGLIGSLIDLTTISESLQITGGAHLKCDLLVV